MVKKPAMIPNKIKYNPASVAFVNPLNKSENTTTTAATVNRINCPQNPQRPNVLHAAAVRETLRAIDSALSTDAFVVTPRLSLVFFAARLVDILIDAEEDAVDDSENTKACLFNPNAFDDDDDEEILPFEGVKALCQTLLRRVRRATKGFRNVGKETDVVSNMMMMMMRVASRKRAQAFLWRHFKRPHSSKYLSLGYQKKEEKGDYKNTNDEHHKTPTPTPCCESIDGKAIFLSFSIREHANTPIYIWGRRKRRTTRRDARG